MNLDLFDLAWTLLVILAASVPVAAGYLLWRAGRALHRRIADAHERGRLDHHLDLIDARIRYQHRKEQQQ